MKTFALQSKLPRLPIPSLEKTIAKYLQSLKPILPADQVQQTNKIAANFLSGQGAVLQQRLVDYEKAQKNGWLEYLWYKKAYLEWNDPIMLNVNWWLEFRDYHPSLYAQKHLVDQLKKVYDDQQGNKYTGLQLMRASNMINSLLDFKETVEMEEMPPETLGKRQIPLCMNQYTMQFQVTRIPNRGCDIIKHQFPSTAKHIIVMIRDFIFKVNVIGPDGERLSNGQIFHQLENCVDQVVQAGTENNAAQVGILTSQDRWVWSDVRLVLGKLSDQNQRNLDLIDNSLFSVCLDGFSFTDQNDLMTAIQSKVQDSHSVAGNPLKVDLDSSHRIIFHSKGGRNRWFDKSLSLVFMNDGHGGVNGEHSPSDAVIPAKIFEKVLGEELTRQDRGGNEVSVDQPQLLSWDTNQSISKAISSAQERAEQDIADIDSVLLHFRAYGGKQIKTNALCGPDAYVQMIMQLAYFRTYSQCCPTYESASTRQFLMGRTETIRACSVESLNWCKAFDDENVSIEDKWSLFAAAARQHTRNTIDASNGQGVDRHLLGLRCMLQKGESSEFFQDPSYLQSMNFKLSSSNVSPSQDLLYGGFGPVVADGYGINYGISGDNLRFSISCRRNSGKTEVRSFRKMLETTLLDVMKFMEENPSPELTAAKENVK
ncbi:hypothetical protein MP228_001821 [Amoeboaphelidium protococcarum]|nr:hypothetical protein MP228_001821 [Amoeboaphelidium protococcarum]